MALLYQILPTIDTSTEQDVAGGGYNHWATAGFFGRLNYNYKEKYLLEVMDVMMELPVL